MSGFAGEEKKEGGCDIPTMFAPGPSTERGHPSNIDTDPAGNRIIYASGSNIVIQAVLDVRPFLHYRGSHPKPTPPRACLVPWVLRVPSPISLSLPFSNSPPHTPLLALAVAHLPSPHLCAISSRRPQHQPPTTNHQPPSPSPATPPRASLAAKQGESAVYSEHAKKTTVGRFNPAGTHVASGDESGQLRVWEAAAPHELVLEVMLFGGGIVDCDWSADGEWIAVVGSGGDAGCTKVVKWDTGSTSSKTNSGGPMKAPLSVSMRKADPPLVITSSEDNATYCYDKPPAFSNLLTSDKASYGAYVGQMKRQESWGERGGEREGRASYGAYVGQKKRQESWGERGGARGERAKRVAGETERETAEREREQRERERGEREIRLHLRSHV